MRGVRKPRITRFLQIGIIVGALTLAPLAAQATLLTGTDFASVQGSLGSIYQGDTTSGNFFANGSPIGTLGSSVYYNSVTQAFTYVLAVTPSIASETRLSTGFLPTLYNNIAGWSWSDAVGAGASGNGSSAFIGILNTTNLSWTASSAWWTSGHTISFFFESTFAPMMSTYNLGGVQNGTASGYAPDPSATQPVPEPGSLLLMGSGAIGIGVWGASRRLSRRRYPR